MRSTYWRQRIGTLAAVIVVIAVVGGGSATAASMITGRQIQDESVTGRDIKNNSLKGADVDENSLGRVRSALRAQSAARVGNLDYNVSDPVANPSGSQDFGAVGCDPGQSAVGGGVFTSSETAGEQSVNSSGPVDPFTWGAYVDNTGPDDETFLVYVICTTADSVSKAPGGAATKK